MKRAVCLATIFLACLPALAEPKPKLQFAEKRFSVFGAIGRYIKTHKLLLASDAMLFAASAADIHYTERCIHAGTCREVGLFMKGRPTTGELWMADTAVNAGTITLTHIADHYLRKWNPDDRGFENQLVRNASTWPLLSMTVTHAVAAHNNAQIPLHMQPGQAKASGAGKP
jgi:hypothetical protein